MEMNQANHLNRDGEHDGISSIAHMHYTWDEQHSAPIYDPLKIVASHGRGEWLWDVDGRRYLDMFSSYSAASHGHCHPRIYSALVEQAKRLTITSRSIFNDQQGLWSKKITEMSGFDKVVPMNSGAEAVETAIKIARKWGYRKKEIPQNKAQIIVCNDGFHGRTSTIVGFSTVAKYYEDFGPYAENAFVSIPFGDAKALEAAITPHTAAFLLEPIQGEAGIKMPPPGFLTQAAQICKAHNVLLVVDEIQTGLCRTGKLFAYQHENIKPDLVIVGKALGGGMCVMSAVLGLNHVMDVLQPGTHGSTFGGNPLACAVSMMALDVLVDEQLAQQALQKGEWFRAALTRVIPPEKVKEVRGLGLMCALEVPHHLGPARIYAHRLLEKGVLVKDTHVHNLRFTPPLVISDDSLHFAIQAIAEVFST